MNFHNYLISWYLQNKRDLPWRSTQNPYLIWLSEIILQQTKVAQGQPYFESFTTVFPTVFELANAQEEEVLKLWQGLGYYSRARNLHKTAQYIAKDCNGIFPKTYKDLLILKGVGEYTAAAIASFAYNEAVPVVDGNVFRVLSRYFDIETDIAKASAKKEFTALAQTLIPADDPAIFNQAIMEFGALQCVPKNPDCDNCVLNHGCLALQKNKVALLPVKSKKAKSIDRYLNYIVVQDSQDQTLVQKRTNKGIWYNLYEFPLIETETETDFDFISQKTKQDVLENLEIKTIYEFDKHAVTHKLSHQNLHIRFWGVEIEGLLTNGISKEKLIKLPFPIVIFNFIEKRF